jgi:hypothetical protein
VVSTQSGNRFAHGVQPAGGFYHFVRAGADVSTTTSRVYLNLAADESTNVMRALVREVVDDAARFPGITEAKVVGSRLAGTRPEAIVIYTQDEAAAMRVLEWIGKYREANPQAFMRAAPPITQPVGHGVGVGAEPLTSGTSFGSVRASAITRALQDPASVDQQAFIRRALELLEQSGVNPQAPYRNLPSGGAAP